MVRSNTNSANVLKLTYYIKFYFFQPACVHVKGVRNIHVSENDISFTPYAGIMVRLSLR